MSFFQQNHFDANAIDITDSYEPLPEGQYRVLVASAEERPTRAGDGLGLNVQYEVVEGTNKGRKLFHWINLRNKNKTTEEIGHKELARLGLATNVPEPRSCAEFCGKLIQVSVKVVEFNGEKRNKIKSIVIPSKDAPPSPSTSSDADQPAWGG